MDPAAIIGTALTDFSTNLGDVAVPAIAVGVGVLTLLVGWRLAKKFVKG